MPVGKGSIERAVKAKNAAAKAAEAKPEKEVEAKVKQKKGTPKKAASKKAPVKDTVIAATSPEVMEMVTGKRPEKAVRVGDQMPDYLL